ncbi:MAG: glycosyltransferase [Actinobacteria bacterium]|nr:glycosyltransferase [Actinomycetota bacterium]
MTGLRVVHVIGGGDTGGAMAYLLPLLSALRGQDCDARLLCLGGGGLAAEAGSRNLPCTTLPMNGPWDIRVLPDLRKYLSGGHWHVVHSHGMRANLPVRGILRLMSSRPALFTTIHSELALDYAGPLKSRAYVALDCLSAGVVDGFFCVSADLARRLAARGIGGSRIRVVYPGVEVPPEATAPQDEPASPEAGTGHWGAATPVPAAVVGTVARLVPVKDISLLLEATRLLRARCSNFRVVVVGDGPERAALERQAADAGLADTVEFRGEVRPIWPVLREFNVYTLTSISEGVPLSVLEAMSTGLPVVATAVGGIPEIIDDGIQGYLVSRSDDRTTTAAALAEGLEALLKDVELRRRMGSAARQRVIERFSPTAAAKATIRFYERILAERSGRGGR